MYGSGWRKMPMIMLEMMLVLASIVSIVLSVGVFLASWVTV